MKNKLSNFIYWGVLSSITIRLAFSNSTLNILYPYTLVGGQWYNKFHPSTYIVLLIFLVVITNLGYKRFIYNSVHKNLGLSPFFTVLLFIIIVNLGRYGTAGLAYLVDTFIVAVLCAMFVTHLSKAQCYRIAVYILCFVCINSLIGIYEYIARTNFLAIERQFGFFRATALFGHPLTNGLIISVLVLALFKIPWRWNVKIPIICLFVLSLFAFGARGALAGTMLGLTGYLMMIGFLGRGTGRKRLAVLPLSYILLMVVGIVFFIVLFSTDFGSSIKSRLVIDASIQVRFDTIRLLQYFSLSEIFWGLSPSDYIYLVDKSSQVNAVENFWIVMLLRLGLPLFALFAATFLFSLYRIARQGGWIDGLMVLVFLLVSSTNNSLSSKNAALMIFLVVVVSLQKTDQSIANKQTI